MYLHDFSWGGTAVHCRLTARGLQEVVGDGWMVYLQFREKPPEVNIVQHKWGLCAFSC